MPRIFLDGDAIEAQLEDSVAAALLRAGVTTFTRSIKYHRPRGPFCFAGSCGQCLMRIDGVPSLPACRVQAAEGMRCVRQNGPLGVENDLFRAADFLLPEGLDHHHLLVRSRLLGRVALEIARRLAGLGELPDGVERPAHGELRRVKLAIVGAGPAGLAAARAAGAGALLIEREGRAGGSQLLFGAPVDTEVGRAELLLDAECVGLYANDTDIPGNALLAVRHRDRLLAVVAEHVVVDTGGGTRIRCDAVAIAQPPAPLHELASSAGAQAHFDGSGFPVQTDAEGRTSVPWLFAAGTVAGKPAVPSGEAAGSAACRRAKRRSSDPARTS